MPIDTLKSKRRLVEEYGLDDRQAEGIVELIAQSEERGATASDVDTAKREILMQLESQISAAQGDLEAQIGSVKSDLGGEMEQLRLEMEQMRRQMLQWMLGVAAFITVLLTLFEYVL